MPTACEAAGWTALVLAGGRGSRLGNVDKAAITIDGTSALDHLLSGLPEDVPVVVAGPAHPTSRPVAYRQEIPIHGGPVAAIAAGLTAVNTPITALLAVDMPWAGVLIRHLVAEFASCGAAALVPVDGSGFTQPLCAVVRTSALREALAQLGDPTGMSLRALMSFVDICKRPLDEAELSWLDDIDTPEDLRRARLPRSPTPAVPQLSTPSTPRHPTKERHPR